jgi:hypothetical protein
MQHYDTILKLLFAESADRLLPMVGDKGTGEALAECGITQDAEATH